MSRAESTSTAQPQLECKSEEEVQSTSMREDRTAGVRTLESSKWWVSRKRGVERGSGR